MNDIYLDPITHDLSVTNLDLHIVEGADRVRQNLVVKLRLWTNEWFLDMEAGTPYLERVLGKQITLNAANAALRKAILEVADVKSITSLRMNFSRSDRKLTVSFECDTEYGLIRMTS